jgi:hypothetical protein
MTAMNSRTRYTPFLLVLGLFPPATARNAVAAETSFSDQVLPLLREQCTSCHNPKKAGGGVDLTLLKDPNSVRLRYDLWKKAVKQVRNNTMPPGEPLAEADRKRMLDWHQTEFVLSKTRDPGPPLLRQLTRNEYSNTIRDLLRINFDAASEAGIPQENVVDGFPNRAGSLVLESSLMEKYLTASDLALEHLFTSPAAAQARKQLLGAPPGKDQSAAKAARSVLTAVLRRAFRRPPTDKEIDRYVGIAEESLRTGDTFEAAIRKAMKPILVSPHFLLRVESGPSTPGEIERITDHELAVRLSYFLWSTMPDEELLDLADKGQLSQPDILEKQVRRMLASPKASALTNQFLTHWLQLPHLQKALPTQNQFPTYTRSLRDAMGQEIRLFCDHLRTADRSILELLDADYTFVNAELARHYGLKTVPAKGFEKVALRPEDHRGGVASMAGVLTMTSHTDRTKPTARGKWILEVLLGSPPPPPPADAGNFAPPPKDRPEPKNFREKLAQHANDRNCKGCHLKVDPLGFALENFDAIGRWRETVGDVPVDNVGTLPGGEEFRGREGLQKVLNARRGEYVENVVVQTLTYALGRDAGYADEPTIHAVTRKLQDNEYRFSVLILGVVKSTPFQHRKKE